MISHGVFVTALAYGRVVAVIRAALEANEVSGGVRGAKIGDWHIVSL